MSKFSWRYITKEDLPTLNQWWDDWGWKTPPSMHMLPADAFMIVNLEDNVNVYAGFLYKTGTSIGWLEFVVSNKSAPVSSRRGAFEYLVETVSTAAKMNGIEMLYSTTVSPAFLNSLKKCGFEVGDVGATNLIKHLI